MYHDTNMRNIIHTISYILFVHIYICTYIHMYTCIFLHMYICTHMIHMSICTYMTQICATSYIQHVIYIYCLTYACTPVRVYTRTLHRTYEWDTYTWYTYIHTHTHTYIHLYTRRLAHYITWYTYIHTPGSPKILHYLKFY